ncbi:hypothetical protein FisN_12Hh127 [Fistulifera solaris]|uniref:Uncharacterized protein n=1 Tax=Fistulifera solaris TaxID=1519565 RepID=A0A1Z5KRG4_FISSO|nr:hypothetical protein FisN_12Hh127 [Fistulifera solaris]|eukprot:GAX28508.1 hypothetical protein FisN_12Hh127 [Fistulifera solaris]
MALNPNGPLTTCTLCHKPTNGLYLFPMSFREIDEAAKIASSLLDAKGRGRKRKGSPEDEFPGAYLTERRTGRWTTDEMAYCDKLIEKFEKGEVPIEDGSKLNEFLGNMLKSKQSRLTKKMKNAKLSTRLFKRLSGYIETEEARFFSELEEAFYRGITDPQERAEIRFHMQKEWREQFSRVCAAIGQPLDAEAWLNSVEEMDRRAAQAKNAARVAKRKLMMGTALRLDSRNPDSGVFIEKTEAESRVVSMNEPDMEREMASMFADERAISSFEFLDKTSLLHSAPFLAKATTYMQRHGIPFEHIDIWVPSYVPAEGSTDEDMTSCRLCYAGSATVDKLVDEDGKTPRLLTSDEQFNFYAFGDYSQKFSFDVGCGLPGRVYESGRPTWEQSVHKAPHNHFERCGGAAQWGIKTVIGLPIASPNVGRIVVTLYSCFDRTKDEDLVSRLTEEFTKLMPSPKWKLVVDIGENEESPSSLSIADNLVEEINDVAEIKTSEDLNLLANFGVDTGRPVRNESRSADGRDPRVNEVIALLGEFTPSDPGSPLQPYLSGFMSLRLLLLRQSRTPEEEDLVNTMLDSFSSYTSGRRERADIAVMLARDCIFLLSQQLSVSQLQNHHFQQQPFQNGQPFLGHNALSGQGSNIGLSVFGLPSTSSSLQNSPALTPIPAPGPDSMSIVSN